jgi:hypothetical protein
LAFRDRTGSDRERALRVELSRSRKRPGTVGHGAAPPQRHRLLSVWHRLFSAEYVEAIRRAKDREEFERFMAERRARSGSSGGSAVYPRSCSRAR